MKILSAERVLQLNNRLLIAVAVAGLFHVVGAIGIIFFNSPFIRQMTPVHLVLMGVLVFFSTEGTTSRLWRFIGFAAALGFLAEIIGVQTGALFGDYWYGTVLGPSMFGVPLLIGLNWAMVLLGAGTIVAEINTKLNIGGIAAAISTIIIGAALATGLDWIMEPVAVAQGYWFWNKGDIPMLNYTSWFGVSAAGLCGYLIIKPAVNRFYSLLFLMQVLFFTLIRMSL